MNSFMVCSFCKSLLVLLLLGGIDIQFYERVPLQYYSLLASTSLIEQHHSIDLTDSNRFFFRDPPTRVPENHPNGRSGVCIDLFFSFINTKVKFCEPVSKFAKRNTRTGACIQPVMKKSTLSTSYSRVVYAILARRHLDRKKSPIVVNATLDRDRVEKLESDI